MSSRALTCERYSCLEIVWVDECFKKFEAFISIVDVNATHKYEVRLERTSPTTGHVEYKTFKVEDAIIQENPEEVDLNSTKQQWTFPEGFADGNTIEVYGATLTKLSIIYKKSRCVSISEIDPKRFYAPVVSRSIEHFRIFPRQDFAFYYFDEVLARRAATDTKPFLLKVFSFESAETGQRRFLVADYDSFSRHYSKDPTNSHHVYEIIRENVPCRAYFDLEYQIEFNKHLDGDSLTATWISLVIWKIFEIFNILLGNKNIIVLDSSTQKKYSKHVILNIPGTGHSGAKTKFDKRDREGAESENKEFLFRNNIVVGSLVNMIINDITTTSHNDDDLVKPKDLNRESNNENFVNTAESGCNKEYKLIDTKWDENHNDGSKSNDLDVIIYDEKRIFNMSDSQVKPQSSLQIPVAPVMPIISQDIKPKKEYEALWVNKENGQKTCFVDLGVYTRNRAFRLWNSSKFGKNVPFKILREDKKRYRGLDISNIGKTWGNVGPNLGSNGTVSASCIRNFNLLQCFVIPLDIYEGVVLGSGGRDELERGSTGSNQRAKRKRDSDRYASSSSNRSDAVIGKHSNSSIINSDSNTNYCNSRDVDDSRSSEGRPVVDEGSEEDRSHSGTLLSHAARSDALLELPTHISVRQSISSLVPIAQGTVPTTSTTPSSSSISSSSSTSSSSSSSSSSTAKSCHLPFPTSAISPTSRSVDLIPHPLECPPNFPNLSNIFDFPTKKMRYVQYLHLPVYERNTRNSSYAGHNGRAQTGTLSSSRSSWRNCEILRSTAYLQSSPFPAVDEFVAKFVTKGGVQGIIGSFC
jgi:hypothetical protein